MKKKMSVGELCDVKGTSFTAIGKMIGVLESQIRKLTPKDDDLTEFGQGVGSSLVAAERMGLKIMGCELEPKYATIANKRIEAERAQLKLF